MLKSGRGKAVARRAPKKPARRVLSKKKTKSSLSRPVGRSTNPVSAKPQKVVAAVSRSRTAVPARSTSHSSSSAAASALPLKVRRDLVQSPMVTKHVAPPRPAVVAPARSMPPLREIKKPVAEAQRLPSPRK